MCPQLAAALARHLNNALIHLGNEAAHESRAHRHHAELLPYAPFMRWLKDMDEKAFDALAKVRACRCAAQLLLADKSFSATLTDVSCAGVRGHVGARVRARGARGVRGGARGAGECAARPRRRAARHRECATLRQLHFADDHVCFCQCSSRFDCRQVLSLVESLCNAEQDFCMQFFFLDIDVKVTAIYVIVTGHFPLRAAMPCSVSGRGRRRRAERGRRAGRGAARGRRDAALHVRAVPGAGGRPGGAGGARGAARPLVSTSAAPHCARA